VRAWGVLLVAGFRRYSSYRAATLGGAVSNSVWGLLRVAVMTGAVSAAGGTLAGYDRRQAITYAWVSQALIGPICVFAWTELALRVRTGDIAVDLARPVDLQAQFLLPDLGRAAYVFLPRGLPPLLVGWATTGIWLPGAPWAWAAAMLSLLLAIGISFGGRYLVNLSAFWLLDTRGPVTTYVMVSSVLAGMYVPVQWFPGWLHTLAACTPFPSMLQTPLDLFAGVVTEPAAALRLLAVQAAWLLGLLATGRAVQARATRKLVVQGG
jgi:ABC-2 type transport system permease protein